jgi:hypothetical protein
MGKSDGWVIFIYFLLVFCAGVIFSFIFTGGSAATFIIWVNSLSNLATVAAAITAVIALRAWYPQFKHSEKFKTAKDLRASFYGSRPINETLNRLQKIEIAKISGVERDSEQMKELIRQFEESKADLLCQHARYQAAWNEFSYFVSEDELAATNYSHPGQLSEFFYIWCFHLESRGEFSIEEKVFYVWGQVREIVDLAEKELHEIYRQSI